MRPTLGVDSALAVIHDANLNPVAFIGSIVGEPTNRVHPALMKEQIRRGEVPNVFLNTATPLVDDEGFIWLVVPSRGTIQRFDPDGSELWTMLIEEPEAQVIFDRFVEANASSGARFPPLNYVLDAFIVSRGLWVLLGHSADGPAAVRLVGMDGEVGERIEFPQISGVHALAVDEGRGLVYFVRGGSAELIRVNAGPAV